MAENPFRILLDFRDLNFKFYKFVWMSVSPRELVTIKDLKHAILKKFSFERTDLHLYLRDGLLPEDENISNILRENDNVRLFHTEPFSLNVSESKTRNVEIETSTSDDQLTSSKKRKPQSDASNILEDSEQVKCNKKRKHSFSNGTYLFENDDISENSALTNAVSYDIENTSSASLNNLEKHSNKSCKIRKKLKYSNEVSQSSLNSENAIFLSSDINSGSKKNESKIKSCKKKKKHSKDIVAMSETNEKEPIFQKRKKKLIYSLEDSKTESASKGTDSFHDGIPCVSDNLGNSINDLESNKNEPSELKESMFETITDESELLKIVPDSFNTSSANTSSGIGSLKSCEKNNQKVHVGKHHHKAYATDSKPVSELDESNMSSQGNSCKKKKRKRHRKRKSSLTLPQIDVSNDCNLDVSSSKDESLDSSFSSTTYQTAKEISVGSKTNANISTNNINSFQPKGLFLKPFSSRLPSTSTPFTQNNTSPASQKSINKIPSIANISQDQSSSLISKDASQEKMNKNSLSTPSLPNSVTKKKNIVSFPSNNLNEKSLDIRTVQTVELNDLPFAKQMLRQCQDPILFYNNCSPLNSCPVVGTHIAFKVLELDAFYSPVVSNYKEGWVKAVNPKTDELEIELIKPEVKEGRVGKFENLYEDELPPCEVIKYVTLSWPTLIDPVQIVHD